MRVFIDTNIYLRFIEPANEKLEALSKFQKNLKKNNVELIFPQITRDELMRNIPLVMGRHTAPIKEMKLIKPSIPAIIKESKAKTKVDNYHKEYPKLLKELVDIYEKSVDKLIKNEIQFLVKNSLDIHEDAQIVSAAQLRRLKGNPPGKGGLAPLGDEIEWEIILQKCFDEDITIITNDLDWIDRVGNTTKLKSFLVAEWKSKTNKKIIFYDTLSEYVRKNIVDVSVTKQDVEAEKKILDLDSLSQIPQPSISNNLDSLRKLLAQTNSTYESLATLSKPLSTIQSSLQTISEPFEQYRNSVINTGVSSSLNTGKCIVCGLPVNGFSVYCQNHQNRPSS